MLLAAALISVTAVGCPIASLSKAPLLEVQSAWLDRFNALDLPCFLQFFADDATVFSPLEIDGATRRIEPDKVAAYWGEVFRVVGAGRDRLSISPRDIMITYIGKDAAVVTFHLSNDPHPARRTLVWRRTSAGWRIAHLHGSRFRI